MKKLTLLLVCLLLFYGLGRLYYKATDDFRLGNVLLDQNSLPNTNQGQDLSQIKAILNRPFTYLGKGAQSYAFSSQDGRYVIKLFKTKHLKRKPHLIQPLLQAHQLAMQSFSKESALIYFQSAPDDHFGHELVLYDKLGMKRCFPLHRLTFVIQKKVEPAKKVFAALLKEQKQDVVEIYIKKIVAHYMDGYRKGIYDHDHGVMHNMGFLEEEAYHMDVGKLRFDPSMKEGAAKKKDLHLMAKRMGGWFQRNFPEEYPYFKNVIDNCLNECF